MVMVVSFQSDKKIGKSGWEKPVLPGLVMKRTEMDSLQSANEVRRHWNVRVSLK
jgi:hypothetical protein